MTSLSFKTKFYIFAVYLLGFAVLTWHINRMDINQPWPIVLLCVLASLSLILRVEGPTRNSHYSFNFLVYGFTFAILGTSETIIVIIVSNVVEKIWNKQAWYIQLFNITCYIISIQVAGLVYVLVNPDLYQTTWQTVLAILFSMTTFNLVNHLMVGIVLWLARGENFKQSGIFESFPLLLDMALLTFGTSLSFVWYYNTFALALFLIPLYLMYNTLRVPALERKTEIDQKTGLFNHNYFMEQLKNELQRANRYDRPLAIIMADLDLLRNINNTYGHLAGDEVLKGLADIMKRSVREYDIVSRFGGEEFAILMPEAEIGKAIERAEIIRQEVEAAHFSIPTSVQPIRATLSLGIATRENFGQTAEEIIHNADAALYNSKLQGRNRAFACIHNTFQIAGQNTATIQAGDLKPTQQEFNDLTSETRDDYSAASRQYISKEPADIKASQTQEPIKPETMSSKQPEGTRSSHNNVLFYISTLAMISILTSILAFSEPFYLDVFSKSNDWIGLLAISLIIITTEWLSIDLYVRNTSLSTTAVPLIAGFFLFGPVGVLVTSLVYATTTSIKYRSPLNRFVFNLSNHVIAGMVIHFLLVSASSLFVPLEDNILALFYALTASTVMFLITTCLISIGIGMDLRQSPLQVWNGQYKWMLPYYLAIGFIAYALIFGYKNTGVIGLMVMMIPIFILRYSQVQYIGHTRDIVTELRTKNQDLEKSSNEINELNEGLLITLSEIIDLRDPYVLGHSKQVSEYSTQIANQLKLSNRQVSLIRKAGLLHDIGKLGIPMEILTKPGKLTRGEYETIKSHAALGGELVKNSPSLRPLVPIIRHHHEFYNGKGYPDKLSGNQISIEARILAVADAIDAMISDRPYRKALRPEQVIDELNRYSGTQFDPLVVNEAIKILQVNMVNENGLQAQKDTGASLTASPLQST